MIRASRAFRFFVENLLVFIWNQAYSIDKPLDQLKHQIRDSYRQFLFRIASKRRKDCTGLLGRIDINATRTHYLSQRNPLDKQCMQYILTGSVDHASRLCKGGYLTDPTCPFCMSSPETAEHIFWECPRWQHIRDTFPVLQLLCSRLGTIWPSCYLLYVAVGFLAITISLLTCCMRVILHMMFLYSLIQNQTLLPFGQYIKWFPKKN